MAGNAITLSPLIPIAQPLETIQLASANVENLSLKFAIPNNIGLLTAYDPLGNQILIQSEPLAIRKPVDVILKPNLPIIPIKEQQFIQPKPNTIFVENIQQANSDSSYHQIIPNTETKNDDMVIYQITYPEDLNLKTVKRGRTKNKTIEKQENIDKEVKPPPVKAPRTRSGRIIKTPKHIEKDFEKILITNEPEVKTTKFLSIKEDKEEKKDLQELEHHFKKKTIPSQYRCSFCKKAYFGKRAMYQHLLKNPNHGPLPDRNNNFDVWNYLVDITQKCPSGRRGTKFCEELTNLLHNLQLLTSALFKTGDATKNAVQVDKVLGNAIGLQPGKYIFDENELYKDVTVLKLITNSQFFAPKSVPNNTASEVKEKPSHSVNLGEEKTLYVDSVKNDSTTKKTQTEHMSYQNNTPLLDELKTSQQIEHIQQRPSKINKGDSCKINLNSLCYNSHKQIGEGDKIIKFNETVSSIADKGDSFTKHMSDTHFKNSTSSATASCYNGKPLQEEKTIMDLKASSSECVESFNNRIGGQVMDTDSFKKLEDNSLSLHSELLSDNSLLALPHLRTTVDELMLSNVDTSSNLLDNSTSSDEVMNVDQFVNERFKKITEPDTDLKFNTSLNLDLPSLDLFQFHTS